MIKRKFFSYRKCVAQMIFEKGWTKIYRAVSPEERDDIEKCGIRPHPANRSLESKQFAPTIEEAVEFGKEKYFSDNLNITGRPNFIIEVFVQRSVLRKAYYFTPDLKRAIDINAGVAQTRLSPYFLDYSPWISPKQ